MTDSDLLAATERAYAQPGHNRPPPDINVRVNELVEAANLWIAERPTIEDEETAKKADGFLGQLSKELKAVEAERKREKEPHLAAAKAVDATYQPFKALLETAYNILKPRLNAYLSLKQKRLDDVKRDAEAEAFRLAREAQEAQAKTQMPTATVEEVLRAQNAYDQAEAAKKAAEALPDTAAVKHEYSDRARVLRHVWKARITNMAAAFLHYRSHPEVAELLTRLASAEARAGVRSIKGFEIYEETV